MRPLRGKERKVKIVTWLLVFCFVISLGISILPVNKLRAESDEKDIPRDIQPPFKSSFSIERLRNTQLHAYEIDTVYPIHAPYPLLLALLTAERFSPERRITLSLTAERVDHDPDLVAGQRYRIDFLLPKLLMEGSRSAAVALSEELGNDIVTQLNDRAKQLGLEHTRFNLAPEDWRPSSEMTRSSEHYPVYSTLRDVSKLINYVERNDILKPFFNSEQYIYYEGDKYKIFRNPLELAWGLSLDRDFMQGAFRAQYGPYATHIYLCQNQGMELAILHFGHSSVDSPEVFTRASLSGFIRRFDWIRNNYEKTTLVYSGDAVDQTIVVEGREIPLYSLQTITYTHPKDSVYLRGEPVLKVDENLRLPIQGNTSLGTLTFELENHQRIAVPVGSMRTVHTSSQLLDRIINHYQSAKTVYHWIFILTGILIVWILIKLYRRIKRKHAASHDA